MKKLFKLGIFLLIMATVLGTSLSQAFNSATHIYIADRVFPCTFDKINLYYGSIAPDIPLYADLNKWPLGFCETHYKFIKLPYLWWKMSQKAFAQGWWTHNEEGGADSFAHGTCDTFEYCCQMDCGYEYGYVNIQAWTLKDIVGLKGIALDFELAHFAIEVAIDLLLIDDVTKDPHLGHKLLKAALFRSPVDFNLMTKVFVGKLGYGTDLETFSSAESTFRNLVIRYALALTLREPLRMAVLGELGVEVADGMGVQIDSATVQEILKTAMILCYKTDYYDTIQLAIDEIKNNPY